MLKLIATTAGAELERLEGHYAVERIEPFVTRVRNLLTEGERRGWTAQAAAQVRVVLADSLFTLGDPSDRNEYLAEAIAAYRAALTVFREARSPLHTALRSGPRANRTTARA